MGEKTKTATELSENALEFVRSRCGSLTVEQYVNRALENIYSTTSQQHQQTAMAIAHNIFDIIGRESGLSDEKIAMIERDQAMSI